MKLVSELPLEETLRLSLRSVGQRTVLVNDERYNIANLKTFAMHGCKCVRCGREGNKLLAWIDNGGGKHVDLFHVSRSGPSRARTNVMMNRDHIIPKSKHGSNTDWNYQPMCVKCNTKKGNNLTEKDREVSKFRNHWKKLYMKAHDFFSRNVMSHLHKYGLLTEVGTDIREVYLHKITFVLAKVSYSFVFDKN